MLIDGRELSQQVLDNLLKRVDNLQQKKQITPHLGIILVGNDPASESYVRQKIKMAHQIHADATLYRYPEAISQKELLEHIDFLQKKTVLHGLIVQLPMPKHLDEETLINSVDNKFDVDGFRENSQFEEPIALAVMRILEEIYELEHNKKIPQKNVDFKKVSSIKYQVSSEKNLNTKYLIHNTPARKDLFHEKENFLNWLRSQNIVVMGKGKTGGKPIINIMKKYGVQPTIIDSKTTNSNEITLGADILVCAVGNRGKLIHDGNIKKDSILIGIGMTKGKDGKLHGDYDAEEIKDKAGYYTPIPGGVGPLNAAMLLSNVVESAERNVNS